MVAGALVVAVLTGAVLLLRAAGSDTLTSSGSPTPERVPRSDWS